jgi:hypothetical protein
MTENAAKVLTVLVLVLGCAVSVWGLVQLDSHPIGIFCVAAVFLTSLPSFNAQNDE